MQLILLSLLVAYASALGETSLKLSANSLPSIAVGSGQGLGLSLGLGGSGNSASSLSVSSQGGSASSVAGIGGDVVSSLTEAVQGGADAAANLATDGAAAAVTQCAHGLGLFAKIHELQHLLTDNGNNWQSAAVQEWIHANGAEFPKVNWTQTAQANGQGFKIGSLYGILRKAQSETAKQLQSLLTLNSNNWNSEDITKWIAENGAKFPSVDWKHVVETSGKDFKIETLLDKGGLKAKFDAILKLEVILRDSENNWNAEAVTKWIESNGDKFKDVDFQKIVADNGKGFTIESLLGNKVNRFRIHDLHARLADSENNWNSESVKQWVQDFGSAFPDVNWTLVVQNNGNGLSLRQLHTHTHGANRSPASQLILLLKDNNSDWKAENVTKWIAEFGAKYPNVKWTEVVANNGANFNWDQLFTGHRHIGARLSGPPTFPGFGGGFSGFPTFPAFPAFNPYPAFGFSGFPNFSGARASAQASSETSGSGSAQVTTGAQQAWSPFKFGSFGFGSSKTPPGLAKKVEGSTGVEGSVKRERSSGLLGIFKKQTGSATGSGSGSVSISGGSASSGSADISAALPAITSITSTVTNGVSSGVSGLPDAVASLTAGLTGPLSGLTASASKEINAAFPALADAALAATNGIGIRANGGSLGLNVAAGANSGLSANTATSGSLSGAKSVSIGF